MRPLHLSIIAAAGLVLGLILGSLKLLPFQSASKPLAIKALPALPDSFWVSGKIGANQGIFQALENMGVSPPQALKIINALRDSVELDAVILDQKLKALLTPDSQTVVKFEYQTNPVTFHRLKLVNDQFVYDGEILKSDTIFRVIDGELEANSTLDAQLTKDGIPSQLVQIVGGILSCKIAFHTDARVGDRYRVLLREERYKGELVTAMVLSAEYQGQRTGTHSAYRFEDTDPKSTFNAHYTPDGEALIHSGLRYPLDRLHISSSYGWRIHPVTGMRAMHAGIDYGAPSGAPVYAVAKGRVVESNFDGYSGNKIAIRHADRTVSYYLHLSRRVVNVGQSVNARQMIGRVGATGRTTGPHLHFGFKTASGNWMNPNQKRMIATPKLEGERYAKLQQQIKKIRGIIDQELSKQNLAMNKQTDLDKKVPN